MSFWQWAFNRLVRERIRRFEEDGRHPFRAQTRRLADILAANRDTEFGREHGFGDLLRLYDGDGHDPAAARRFVDAYRARVPLRTYEDFAPAIARMQRGEANVLVGQPVVMYNMTSGSSGDPKHCPITRRFTLEHHASHLVWMNRLLRDHPRLLPGPYLTVVSPAASSYAPDGTPIGSSSGRQAQDQAWIIRRRQVVPYPAFAIKDYAARHHAVLAFALGRRISAAVSVNPSTLVFLGKRLEERAEALIEDVASGRLDHLPTPDRDLSPHDRALLDGLRRHMKPRPARARELRERLRVDGRLLPANAWPDMAAIATWQGGSAPFYVGQARRLWGDTPMRCLGLRASEGTFSIPLEDHSPAGVLAVGGAFMEFLPADVPPGPDTPTLLAHELEVGQRYRLLFTTSGGFYRYDIADVVEVADRRDATPVVAFLHRAGRVLSITGEKVTEAQVVDAMRPLAEQWPALAGFAVTLEQPDPDTMANPRYVLAVEWNGTAPSVTPPARGLPDAVDGHALAQRFDRELARRNPEYADKRADGRLERPMLLALARGSFARQRKAMVDAGCPDGQIKPPHLVPPGGVGPAPIRPCPFFDHVDIAGRWS